MSKLRYLLVLLTGLLLACDDEAASFNTPEEKQLYITAEQRSTVSAETLKALAIGFGQPDVAKLIQYGVRSYTFSYTTTYQGKTIEASGLLMIPDGMKSADPMVSLQHGTTFVKEDAPTATGGYNGMELFSAAGFIALMPDYIGYGKSSDIFHPYYDEEHSSLAVIDMIKAVKQFLTKEEIQFNDKLFLAGYSEGGYVTLAAAHELETNTSHGLEVTAVAAGAGGYDLREMLSGISASSYYSYPSYLAFVLMSYNNTYGWNKPLNYFFQQKYADALETYMNGEYEGYTINQKLTTDLNDLFHPDFYARLKQTGQEQELKDAIVKNSIDGWSTNIPVRLYHGTKDEIIPYKNSEATLDNFKNAGSTSVTLTPIPNGTHGSSFMSMMQDFVPWFLSLQ